MRRGSALPLAIFALALIAALVLGTTFITRRLAADARLAERSATVGPLAEQAVVDALAAWDSASRAAQPVGAVASLSLVRGQGVTTTVSAIRLTTSLYWIVGGSQSGSRPVLGRRFGVLVSTLGGAPALVPGRAWGDLP